MIFSQEQLQYAHARLKELLRNEPEFVIQATGGRKAIAEALEAAGLSFRIGDQFGTPQPPNSSA